MSKKFLITSALPYANGPLHFGHIAGAYLPADCYARYQRLRGEDVLYICGSDEHGVAITLSAELAGRTPQEHVNLYHEMIQEFFHELQISFDHYSRTSWEGHIPTVQEFFFSLKEKGYIEERTENHLFSEKENRFLADRYVVGTCPKCGFEEARGDECQRCASSYEAIDLKNPRSKLGGSLLIQKPSTHLYLRFDRFKEELQKWMGEKKWKSNVLHFASSYVQDLKPRAITRDSSWGVPVPGYPDKVFYVWFDAPIGYISATKEWAEKQKKPDSWEDYWLNPECQLVHFIGKDNIPFHTVFFPAMLMGQTKPYILPSEVPANEFYLLEGKQFSKSDGWTIDLSDFFSRYTSDQIRYAIASNAPETSDSEFSWKDFQMRCNSELLGKFGNFVNRVLVFTKQHMHGVIPSMSGYESPFFKEMESLVLLASQSFETFHLRRACQVLMELSQRGNVFFDAKKPWELLKKGHMSELQEVISLSLECVKNLALIASPIVPTSSEKIWKMLGFSTQLSEQKWEDVHKKALPAGQALQEIEILFRKVEDQEVEDQVMSLESLQKKSPFKPQIAYEDFSKLDFRVAQILEAEKLPKSKKLLKLLVDLGSEKRTVVSGISNTYEPESLVGKKVIIVANLAPTQIMGVRSEGMILAASSESGLELVEIQHLPPGSVVS